MLIVLFSLNLTNLVILLVMIGPEERKVDHVKEHIAEEHFGEPEFEKIDAVHRTSDSEV